MKTVTFCTFFCGMSGNTFSNEIMIYAPFEKKESTFQYDAEAMRNVDDFISIVKKECEWLDEYNKEKLNTERLYIMVGNALIGIKKDKMLRDIFIDFSIESITFNYFVIVGGASMSCRGYRFVVHPNEEIHKHTPHVHVENDDCSVRYSLVSLKRFEQDKVPRNYLRDEKKIIRPFLENNRKKLLEYWNLSINGYTTPIINEKGQQYYPES